MKRIYIDRYDDTIYDGKSIFDKVANIDSAKYFRGQQRIYNDCWLKIMTPSRTYNFKLTDDNLLEWK